jgi:hypothetical protein
VEYLGLWVVGYVTGRKRSFISLINVVGVLHKPNGITNH